MVDTVLHEREPGRDVGLGGDVALAVGLVGSDRDVGDGRLVTDPFLDRLDLHVLGAPAHLRRWKRAPEHLEPVVEASRGVQPGDGLSEDHLQAGQVLVGLRQFSPGVAEEVLHVGHPVAEVDRECAGVLASGDAADVTQ